MMETLSGAAGRSTLPGHATSKFSKTKGDTLNNRSVRVIKGELVAQPFQTSATKPKADFSETFGKINTVLNPPNKERTSTYRSQYNNTSRTAQSAGTVNKRQVPYHPNAFRNRLKNEPKRLPPPFTSTLDFDMGVLNKSIHPYRTIKSATEAPTVKPMESRRGFTNSFLTAEMTKRWHKSVWAQ